MLWQEALDVSERLIATVTISVPTFRSFVHTCKTEQSLSYRMLHAKKDKVYGMQELGPCTLHWDVCFIYMQERQVEEHLYHTEVNIKN